MLYKELGNLRILHRESALLSTGKTDKPFLDVLRMAPVLPCSTEEQYSPAMVAQVAALYQSLTHQSTASVLRTLMSQRDGSSPQNRPLDPPGVAPVHVAPEVVSPTPGRLSLRRLLPKTPRVSHTRGKAKKS